MTLQVQIAPPEHRDTLLREYAVHGAEGQPALGRFLVARLNWDQAGPDLDGLVFRWTDLLADGDVVLVDANRPIDHYLPDRDALRAHIHDAGIAA